MARKLISYVEITDDFDSESPADETIEVAIDGIVYEVDLSSVRAKEVREFLSPYQEVAHKQWKMPPRPDKKRKRPVAQELPVETKQAVKPDKPRKPNRVLQDREARAEIRAWGDANGHASARIGKIPVELLQAFIAANPDAYVPATTLADAGLA